MTNLVPVNTNLPSTNLATLRSAGGSLFGAAKNLLGKGLRLFSNLHPAAKAVAIAGTALVATNALSGSKHEAAQRVA